MDQESIRDISHGDDPAMKAYHFMEWNNKRLDEFCKTHGHVRPLVSPELNSQYESWLLAWVRNMLIG